MSGAAATQQDGTIRAVLDGIVIHQRAITTPSPTAQMASAALSAVESGESIDSAAGLATRMLEWSVSSGSFGLIAPSPTDVEHSRLLPSVWGGVYGNHDAFNTGYNQVGLGWQVVTDSVLLAYSLAAIIEAAPALARGGPMLQMAGGPQLGGAIVGNPAVGLQLAGGPVAVADLIRLLNQLHQQGPPQAGGGAPAGNVPNNPAQNPIQEAQLPGNARELAERIPRGAAEGLRRNRPFANLGGPAEQLATLAPAGGRVPVYVEYVVPDGGNARIIRDIANNISYYTADIHATPTLYQLITP